MRESKLYKKLLEFHKKYEIWVGPGFFVLGFLFDILTLGRIDDPLNILSQGFYLCLLYSYLYFELTKEENYLPKQKYLKAVFQFKDEIFHFFLGALLSAFTLFYFKSSSLSVSFSFMFCIFLLLFLNEFEFIQKAGAFIKATLLYLCLLTYFLYLVPLAIGKVGFFPFLISILISLIVLFLFLALLNSRGVKKRTIRRRVLTPSLSLVGLFILFYLLKIIPPIPLSVQHLGIYHNVEKKYPEYRLHHENPWWRFWSTGDQIFISMPGDKVYVFARVFAPGGFDDKIILHFLKNTSQGFKTSDKIPLSITGGRGDGFRGFAFKSNYTAGDWRVQVETAHGLEIGRIEFEIQTTGTAPREFKIDVQ